MIFIAGIQPKTRRLDANPRTCASCGSPEAYLKRIDHFVSVFFIPLIPIKRGEPMLGCENCGAVLTETGKPLWTGGVRETGRCSRCGQMVEREFSYCPHCGTRLE